MSIFGPTPLIEGRDVADGKHALLSDIKKRYSSMSASRLFLLPKVLNSTGARIGNMSTFEDELRALLRTAMLN